jgi:hypothetical protein
MQDGQGEQPSTGIVAPTTQTEGLASTEVASGLNPTPRPETRVIRRGGIRGRIDSALSLFRFPGEPQSATPAFPEPIIDESHIGTFTPDNSGPQLVVEPAPAETPTPTEAPVEYTPSAPAIEITPTPAPTPTSEAPVLNSTELPNANLTAKPASPAPEPTMSSSIPEASPLASVSPAPAVEQPVVLDTFNAPNQASAPEVTQSNLNAPVIEQVPTLVTETRTITPEPTPTMQEESYLGDNLDLKEPFENIAATPTPNIKIMGPSLVQPQTLTQQ